MIDNLSESVVRAWFENARVLQTIKGGSRCYQILVGASGTPLLIGQSCTTGCEDDETMMERAWTNAAENIKRCVKNTGRMVPNGQTVQ